MNSHASRHVTCLVVQPPGDISCARVGGGSLGEEGVVKGAGGGGTRGRVGARHALGSWDHGIMCEERII